MWVSQDSVRFAGSFPSTYQMGYWFPRCGSFWLETQKALEKSKMQTSIFRHVQVCDVPWDCTGHLNFFEKQNWEGEGQSVQRLSGNSFCKIQELQSHSLNGDREPVEHRIHAHCKHFCTEDLCSVGTISSSPVRSGVCYCKSPRTQARTHVLEKDTGVYNAPTEPKITVIKIMQYSNKFTTELPPTSTDCSCSPARIRCNARESLTLWRPYQSGFRQTLGIARDPDQPWMFPLPPGLGSKSCPFLSGIDHIPSVRQVLTTSE